MESYQTSSKLFRHYRSGCLSNSRLAINSQYQIKFFSTGKGSAAVCLRYGVPGDYRIMVYDGGVLETGKALVSYIREHYGTDVVHDVICSHPNADHALGLWPVLENLDVQTLWMHRPWEYSSAISRHLQGVNLNTAMTAHFSDKLAVTYALEKLAIKRNIVISEPFQGKQIGPMMVMSPHRDWFVHTLVPDLASPPPARRVMSPEVHYLLQRSGIRFDDPVVPPMSESWERETLQESGSVNVEMESSVVLFGLIGGQGILLTGNAGIKALSNAAGYAEYQRLLIPTHLRMVQVPNQGNCNHVSPSVLDRLIGIRLPTPTILPRMTAFVASSLREERLPHQSVVNALIRRGAQVFHTKANHSFCLDQREGKESLDILRFSAGV